MTEDKSRITRWALGELTPAEAAEMEAELSPLHRTAVEAHRDFCQRAAAALAQDHRGLPGHKRAAILAAFAVRERAAARRRARLRQMLRGVQYVLAVGVFLALGAIVSKVPQRPFAAQQLGGVRATAPTNPELEVANYRLATLTAYLEAAEARLRAAELAEEARREEAKPAKSPLPASQPKAVPEARLHVPFAEPFSIAQIRLSR